jgi:hypothetical protein
MSVRCRFFRSQLEWLEKRKAPAGLPPRFANAELLSGSGQVVQGMLVAGQSQDYSVSVTGEMFLLATAAAQSSLVVVATLLSGELVERSAVLAGDAIAGKQLLGLFLPPVPGVGNGANKAQGGNDEAREGATQAEALPRIQGEEAPEWQRYRLGAEDALNARQRRHELMENLRDTFDALKGIFNWFQNKRSAPGEPNQLDVEWPVEVASPEAARGGEENGRVAKEEIRQQTRDDEPLVGLTGALLGAQEDRFSDSAALLLLSIVEGLHVAGQMRRRLTAEEIGAKMPEVRAKWGG